jgi:hypothetical protein
MANVDVQHVAIAMPDDSVAIMQFVTRQHASRFDIGWMRDATDQNIEAEIARAGLSTPKYWRRISLDEIPQDRTHRSAWRLSHNGGPVWIDEQKAQEIDEARMWTAYERQTA